MMSGVSSRANASRRYGGRALPLPPDERRLHLLEIALHLVRTTGAMPSTRQIALAAGVAEGTLFRAFGTKDALRAAMIAAVACPYPYRDAVDAIDPALPLRPKLLALATLLWDRFADIFQTLGPLGVFGPPAHGVHPGCPGDPTPLDAAHFRDQIRRLLQPHVDANELRVPVDDLVDALRFLCFAGSNRGITDNRLLRPERIVDILLDGSARHDVPAPRAAPPDAPIHAAPPEEPPC